MKPHVPRLAALAGGLALMMMSMAASRAGGQEAGPADSPAAATPGTEIGRSFQVPYRLTDTNHWLVRVRLNGKGPFNFLVDSGAPALYVGTEAAKKAGLVAAEDDYWTKLDRLDLEGGAVLLNMKARVEDPFQLVGMNALGLPGASIDGILGYTILARFRLEFDPTRDRMTWTRIAFEPKEPFLPKWARTKKGPAAPADLQAMQAMGPLMKLMSVFVGKQPEEKALPQGYLGLVFDASKAKDDADGGVPIVGVLDGSPAATAGARVGDVLLRIRGKNVASAGAAHEAVEKLQPGDRVALSVRRDGRSIDLTVTAGEGL
jgi:membrane-associated protease RseP (regulator of RpoE activity)